MENKYDLPELDGDAPKVHMMLEQCRDLLVQNWPFIKEVMAKSDKAKAAPRIGWAVKGLVQTQIKAKFGLTNSHSDEREDRIDPDQTMLPLDQ